MTPRLQSRRLPAVLLLAVLPGLASCTTPSPDGPARAKVGSTLEAYRAAAEAVRRNPNDPRREDEMIRLGRRLVDEYLAGEDTFDAVDLWGRAKYLGAYPRTGLVFDRDIDFRLRDVANERAGLDTQLDDAEASSEPWKMLETATALARYAPYTERVPALRARGLSLLFDGARSLGPAERLELLIRLKPYEPLGPEADERARALLDEVLAGLKTPDLVERMNRVVGLAEYGDRFDAIRQAEHETRQAAWKKMNALAREGRKAEAVRIALAAAHAWPRTRDFVQFSDRVFEGEARRLMEKVAEVETAGGDRRTATRFVYALAAWRFAPLDASARSAAIHLASRMPMNYGITADLKVTQDAPRFMPGVEPRLRKKAVATSPPSFYAALSKSDVLITVAVMELDTPVDTVSTTVRSTHSSGSTSRNRVSTPYTYTEKVHTLRPFVEITYTITDNRDGETLESGSFSRTRQIVLRETLGVHGKDTTGAREETVNLYQEKNQIAADFRGEMERAFAADLAEKTRVFYLRTARRAQEAGYADEARDRIFVFKLIGMAEDIVDTPPLPNAAWIGPSLETMPHRLRKAVAGSRPTPARDYEDTAVVRETVMTGRPLPAAYEDLEPLLRDWDADTVECNLMPETEASWNLRRIFQ